MKPFKIFFCFFLFLSVACQQQKDAGKAHALAISNTVKHAKGLEIYRHKDFTVVKVTNPWPDAQQHFTYVLHKKDAVLPDSLRQFVQVQVPLQSVVVTSTTHIPSLEMLGVEKTLKGFPGINYVSSLKVRALIDAGKIKEAGENENINTEVMIDLAPQAVVGFSISSDNKAFTSLQQSGIPVLYNGDWTEQTPLGKAEWIKFFGALYGMEDKADKLFIQIEKDYLEAKKLAVNASTSPSVMCGAMYMDQWLLPQGGSWAALFLKDAHANYLWQDTKGTGSLKLAFEAVLDKAENAEYWIGPTQFKSLKEMTDNNPHYSRFKSFRDKTVYSFSTKQGPTGGLLYYELAPNRPDLVLKDMVKILHPELLPNHELHFFEKLK